MITNPIFLAKNMTPRFLRWSSCSNISVILPLIFLAVFPKIQKHWSLVMATLTCGTCAHADTFGHVLQKTDTDLPTLLLVASLQPSTSKQAESNLNQLSLQLGFITALL